MSFRNGLEPGGVVGRETAGVVGIGQQRADAGRQERRAGVAADAAQELVGEPAALADRGAVIAQGPLDVVENVVVVLAHPFRPLEPLIERRPRGAQLRPLASAVADRLRERVRDVAVGAPELVVPELLVAARTQLPEHTRGERLRRRLAHPVHQEHGRRPEAGIVGELGVLEHVGELVGQEHDLGRIGQAREHADQAHLRAVIGREMGVRIVADQHGAKRRLVDQPGAKGALRHQIEARGDLPLRGRGRRADRDRKAGLRMVRDQVRDPDPPPWLEEGVGRGAAIVLDRRHRRTARTNCYGPGLEVGGLTGSRGEHAGGQAGKNLEPQRIEHGEGDLPLFAPVR